MDADSQELIGNDCATVNAFDGNQNTMWHTKWQDGSDPQPHEIQINLENSYDLTGFRYLPRQDGCDNGRIRNYEFYTSADGSNWSLAPSGAFSDNANEQEIVFNKQERVRYIRLRSLSAYDNDLWTSIAEINLLGTLSSGITNIVYEDAEDETINGWGIYDNIPIGAVINNVLDSARKQPCY
ncbi:MAG: discoidin domain-containing protein [Candidatus Pacebacteria bacterium]|nr:discoidin domain-containing protein [Candidatus Paceibacterota bacterium]